MDSIESPVIGRLNGTQITKLAFDLMQAQANHCAIEGYWPAPPKCASENDEQAEGSE